MRTLWVALPIPYLYSGSVYTFVSTVGVTVAAAARFLQAGSSSGGQWQNVYITESSLASVQSRSLWETVSLSFEIVGGRDMDGPE
jgi:hypothetical protein